MNYRLISSGSKGNCIIYNEIEMVDLGIKKKDRELITPYLDSVKVIIISHRHVDHIQISMMKWIIENYPKVMFVYGDDVQEYLHDNLVYKQKGEVIQIEVPRFKIVDSSKPYDFGLFKLNVLDIYHDVPNFAFYIRFKDDYTVFHATDTYTLEGIKIPSTTNLVAIEHHHEDEHYRQVIESKQESGKFVHEIGARNSHHSFEQANSFLERNKLYGATVLRLHLSSDEYYKDVEVEYIFKGESKNES